MQTRCLALRVAGALAALALTSAGVLEAQKKDRDLITRDELVLASARTPDLLLAVRSLRSHMVDTTRGASRGVRSMDIAAPGRSTTGATDAMGSTRNTPAPTPVLYVDGQKVGHLTLMKDILTSEVEEVKYLNPNRAANDLGLGHEGGAIMVKMFKPPSPTPPRN